jgi:hypothetical protein
VRDTIWVYRGPSEASEILNAPEELALWATAGYLPAVSPSSSKPEPVPLRMDGPTLEEYIEAGYKAESYPPQGYAPKPSVATPAQAPESTPANPAEQPPEGSTVPAAGPSDTLTPPDAAGDGTGIPATAPTKPEGKKKG